MGRRLHRAQGQRQTAWYKRMPTDILLFWFISPNLISKIRSTRFQSSESSQSLTHSSPGTWTSVLLMTNGNWPGQGLPSTHSPSCQGISFLLIWPLPSLYPHTAKQKPLHTDPENKVTITWPVASLSHYTWILGSH